MARKASVTRTITTTKVNVLCLNLVSAEPFNEIITLAGTYKDDKLIMKQVALEIDNEEVKAVHVVDKEIIERRYGMPESTFIQYAEELPSGKKSAE